MKAGALAPTTPVRAQDQAVGPPRSMKAGTLAGNCPAGLLRHVRGVAQ